MSKPKVAFDSCSILHLLIETAEWLTKLNAIFEDARKGNSILFISEISVAECARLHATDGNVQAAAKKLEDFFSHPFIERRGLTGRESALAKRLIRDHNIGPCDAMIAATAVYYDCSVLWTTDGCNPRRKAGKLLTVKKVTTECGKSMDILCPQ